MTMLAQVEDRGCHLFFDGTGQMHLEASPSVSPEVWGEVVSIVRQHRQALIAELQDIAGRETATPAAAPNSERDMAAYPHLAPCPLRGGQWVYRGQVCTICDDKPRCPSWNVQTFTPSVALPTNIKPMVRLAERGMNGGQ